MSDKSLELFNAIFQGFILLLQFVLVIIPLMGTKALYDGRNTTKPILKRFSKRGKYFVILGIILIIVSFSQTKISEKLNNIEHRNTVKNDSLRSLFNKREILNANFRTNEMLAKYGLKVDTKSNEIVKILKDPNSRKTTNVYGEDPVLDLSEAKVNGKEIFLKFTSYFSTSYDINVEIDLLGEVNNRTTMIVRDRQVISENTILLKDHSLENTWTIDHKIMNISSRFYFKLHGTYKKSDGTIIPIENFYALDKNNDNRIGSPVPAILYQIKDAYNEEHYK